MTMQKRFANLTQEQREKFLSIKDEAQLDAFLSENKLELSDGEKKQALEYTGKGALLLSAEELENVAGGGCVDTSCPRCKSTNTVNMLGGFIPRHCMNCGYEFDALFS